MLAASVSSARWRVASSLLDKSRRSQSGRRTDLPERGHAYDRQRFGKGPRIDELSHLSLDRQVRHEGTTWLDRTMLDGGRENIPHTGFGGDVCNAWEARKKALADMGYARDLSGGKFRAPSDLLPQIDAPTLLICGQADALFGVDYQQRLLAALPNAWLEILPGLGHSPHWEEPARVAALIAAFAGFAPASAIGAQE